MKIMLKARTGYGLTGPEFYTETFEVEASDRGFESAKRQFSVKYGVDLDRIEITEVMKDA